MSGHAGDALHYHGFGDNRYGHRHWYWHINHEHENEEASDTEVPEEVTGE